jgi:hypothetical protein
LLSLSSRAAHAETEPVLVIEATPQVSFRGFRDSEPTSADKSYSTSAIFGGGVRVQAFPLPAASLALRRLGAYVQGSVGFLSSQDVDVPLDDLAHDVATSFWRAGAGLLYRLPLHLGVVPLTVTLLAGAERWSFSFDMPKPPLQLTPTAGYSFARVGADAAVQLGRVGLSANGNVLLPWSIEDLGDRAAQSTGWGVQAGLGASFLAAAHFDLIADARYTVFRFPLPQILPRTTASAEVSDTYLEFLVGGRCHW